MIARTLTLQVAAAFLACIALSPLKAAIIPLTYSTGFTSANDAAWTEGGDLSDSDDWLAQASWDTTDVAGDGFATSGTDFQRAVNTGGSFSMNVGDSVTLTLTLNVLGDWGENNNENVMRLGLSEVNDPGAAQVNVGVGITAVAFDSTLRLRLPDYSNTGQVTVSAWDDAHDGSTSVSDELSWTVTITKTPTADTFDVVTQLDDTEGANQGSGTANFTILNTALYAAGTLYPVIQMGQNDDGITGVQLDTLTIGTIPEPSTLLLGLIALVPLAALRRRR